MDENNISEPREGRRHRGDAIWIGITFILLGILLILRMTGAVRLAHWWALFILIPALASLGAAVNNFIRSGGRFTHSVAGALGGALFIGAVAVIFLFNLNWGRVWPVFIILAGVSVLINTFGRKEAEKREGEQVSK